MDHVTLAGSNEADSVQFYRGVLGMPFVLRQANLDRPEVTHLFFDAGDGRVVTSLLSEERDAGNSPDSAPTPGLQRISLDDLLEDA